MIDGITMLALFIGLLIGAWMAKDSRDRGASRGDQLGLFIIGVLFNFIAVIIYWAFRPTKFKKQ